MPNKPLFGENKGNLIISMCIRSFKKLIINLINLIEGAKLKGIKLLN